jgi:hypothetical protein
MKKQLKPNKKTKAAMKEARKISKETSDMGILNQNEIDALLDALCSNDNSKPKKLKIRKPTGKIDKETFIIVMNLIIAQDNMNHKLDESLNLINSSWTITEPDINMRKALYKMLAIFFNDYELENIDWFLYDSSPKIFYEKNKKTGKHDIEHKINNTGDLYDYMINWRKKK